MRLAALATAVGITLLGTIAIAQNVSYDYDRSADFSKYKTYAWADGTRVADELNHKRVMRAIDAQLTMKGLQQVYPGSRPDVLVAYHASFDTNLQIDVFGTGFPRFGGMRSGTATTQEIVTGTMVVDIKDANTNAIVWRGTASKELNASAKPEKREKEINKAAEKVFKNYPPQS
jgi:uncharacterized protein DUF4136